MSVTHPARESARRRPAPTDLAAGATGLGLLLAGLAGVLPPVAALALAVGVAAAVAATRLVLASRCRAAARGGGASRSAERSDARAFGRAANLLDLAVFATGLSVAVLPLVPPADRPAPVLAGLLLAAGLHLGGLLRLPGAAPSGPARLRQVVDATSLGISLAFAGWVALPAGPVPPSARTAALLGAAALAVATVTALAGWGPRRGVALCGLGTAATLFGLAALTVLVDYDHSGTVLLVLVPPLVAGPLLTAAGAEAASRAVRSGPAERPAPAYPLLTVPAVVTTVAAVYHLLVVGRFDTPAVLLGLAVIPPLVLREVLAARDIRRYARRLATQEAYFRSLVSGANDLTLVVGADLLVRWQSPGAARLFGLTDAEVLGRPFGELIHPDDASRVAGVLDEVLAGRRPPLVAARFRDGRGTWRDTESTVTDQRAVPEVGALVIHVRDVSERRRLERTVQQLAVTDQLTGLANRRELMRAIAVRRVARGRGALLVVDLHGMAGVNDDHGRTAGDEVLAEAGRRLRAAAGPDDVVARLAGDEFAVAAVQGPVLAYALGTRLLGVLTEPYPLPGGAARLQVSIGLAEFAGGTDVDDVLRQADLARRRARQLGRNRVEWYDAGLEEQLVRRLDLERELPGAAARGEFDLVFQPVLGLADRFPVGTEALLRWRSPVLGTVLPAELLPVAEDLGLMEEVGQWVLHRACRQLTVWSEYSRELWMSVNVSPRELVAPDFAHRTSGVLAEHGLAADRLVLEVSEPRLGTDVSPLAGPLAALRALGVRIALDDFGGAQTSLAQLRRLPLDLLKVDPRLLRETSGDGGRLIDVVVGLGRRLGVEIVAEGLESPDQVDQADRAGCRFGQGFALSRPATAERVEAYLEDFPSAPR
ncbi:putative bifunctional diguanylate cyclase/phosphodiesterase [Micromonospora echinofusca]|uniref:putative bifunctional diguanylate cyclase/phosphodiesterase n=1 Tax=Micromonospora echinofusca TaxID=47858 RepID=UPI0027DE74C5|nr:EAL domain-containing protein [Micromonospora echinofusca]